MPEHTIAENLTRLQNAKTAIGNAITAKGGTVSSGDGLEDFASDIATIPSGGGGGSQPRKDVNFYDYDGTIVNSYTASEFANLSAMPSSPSHDGLTAQGWNWSLSDAKTYVASYGKLEIGQMYITSDGNTRLYITLSEGRTSPILQLYLDTNSELDIDWGDGSTHSSFTGSGYQSERHNYANAGEFIIVISVISGGFSFSSSMEYSNVLSNGNSGSSSPDISYNNAIRHIRIGSNAQILSRAFSQCNSLSSITIPNSITTIGQYSFYYCNSLTSITIPNSVTSIESYIFSNCSSFSSISIPNTITSISSGMFNACSILTSITIPNSVTSISSRGLYYCKSLASITIPNSMLSIHNSSFEGCYSLATITIDKTEGSISGSPWGATTGSPTSTQIIWTGE